METACLDINTHKGFDCPNRAEEIFIDERNLSKPKGGSRVLSQRYFSSSVFSSQESQHSPFYSRHFY
jgi:hypothetical protein